MLLLVVDCVLFCCVAVPLLCCFVVFVFVPSWVRCSLSVVCCVMFDVLLHCCVVVLSVCWFVGLLFCFVVALRLNVFLCCRFASLFLLVCWFVGVPV